MKICLVVLSIGVLLAGSALSAGQQQAPKSPAQLELTMEVATTTEDGLPAALRFTLRNIGYGAVDLPQPALDCEGSEGTIRVQSIVRFEGREGTRGGHNCGGALFDGTPFLERVRAHWFHLLPGEYITLTGDRRTLVDKADAAATYEYWAEYQPPILTSEQRKLAVQSGYMVPAEKVESDHLSYSER